VVSENFPAVDRRSNLTFTFGKLLVLDPTIVVAL
jgi:hypothetical protein